MINTASRFDPDKPFVRVQVKSRQLWIELENRCPDRATEERERYTAIQFEREDFLAGMSFIWFFSKRDPKSGIYFEK